MMVRLAIRHLKSAMSNISLSKTYKSGIVINPAMINSRFMVINPNNKCYAKTGLLGAQQPRPAQGFSPFGELQDSRPCQHP